MAELATPPSTLDLMRVDLSESLAQSNLNPLELSPFQRILIATDGTVTEIVEAQYLETIRIVKLDENTERSCRAIPHLESKAGDEIYLRKVMLRGKITYRNYIYAESIILPSRVENVLQMELQNTSKPIGKLLLENRTETYREIMACGLEAAGELADYFGLEPDDALVSRTYRVFANREPMMLISEKFPFNAFRD